MTTQLAAIDATRQWLIDFIIAHNICPFARREHERGSIRYQLANGDIESQLATLIDECMYLDSDPDTETTLLILDQNVDDFDDFLDFTGLAEQLLVDQGYEGIYQLASFHPLYCFADAPIDDAANYTNRSPFPMLHIIRESSIEAALKHWPNPENIPDRNIAFCRSVGVEKLEQLRQQALRLAD